LPSCSSVNADAAVHAAVDTLCDDSDALTVAADGSVAVVPLPVTTLSIARVTGAVVRTVVGAVLV
jgi:hypothetical protein